MLHSDIYSVYMTFDSTLIYRVTVNLCCNFFLQPRECLSILHVIQKSKGEQEFFYEFEGGVKLGIGAFNLVSK